MFIELGEIKINLLILLIYPVGIISARVSANYYSNNPYFYLFLFFLSHYLALLLKLIYMIKEKIFRKDDTKVLLEKKKKEETIKQKKYSQTNNSLLYFEFGKRIKRKKIMRILFIGILYFITYVFFYYFNFIASTNFYGNISMIMEILYFSLFEKLILGNKIYSHHLLSMIIITISILGLYILLIFNFIQNNDWDIWRDIFFPTILNFIVYLIFCYYLIQAKSYIEKYFISPYELLIYLGSLGLILLFIFEPFTFYISCNNPVMCYDGHFGGIISGFKQISDLKGILISILWFFCLFLTAFGLWLTVIYLSPSHFLTSDSIITFGLNIMIDCYIGNFQLLKNPLFYILSILTIFGCLLYNEIIILKIFGFNYNTRKEIIKRQNDENYENNEKSESSLELLERPSLDSINSSDSNNQSFDFGKIVAQSEN